MAESSTDCRSEEGITVGLVDAIISIARVLARRPFSPPVVKEALADLRNDDDVNIVMGVTTESLPRSSPLAPS